MGNLLERNIEPILWVDDAFSAGRLNRCYREAPSNTKVGLFIDFATAVAPFRRILNSTPSQSRWEEPSDSDSVSDKGKPDKLQDLRQLDPTKGCRLSHAADMCLTLTRGLQRTPGVTAQLGKVTSANLDESSSTWNVQLVPKIGQATDAVFTKRLILCTGSSPNNSPLPVDIPSLHSFDLDAVLKPTLLSTTLTPMGPTTIAIIGASHSAILCLLNLYNLASSTKPDLKIKWFTRHPLRYAEYMPDGWILRDSTGLKGEAATWAKENLEPETMHNSDVSNYITKIQYPAGQEKQVYAQHMQDCDFYVQAIGYDRDPAPKLVVSGKSIQPQYNHESGAFSYVNENDCGSLGNLSPLPGVYGAGIAWPERVKDPHGNVEYAVGFWKFMKYVRRVSPEWN